MPWQYKSFQYISNLVDFLNEHNIQSDFRICAADKFGEGCYLVFKYK